MVEDEITETTALISSTPKPRYAFESSIVRKRRRNLRRFQCCVCVIFLGIIIVAVVLSVACSINEFQTSETNITTNNITESFIVLKLKNSTEYINDNEYREALNVGKSELRKREEIEKNTPELDVDSPSYKHQKVVATSCKGRSLSRIGYAEEFATRHLNRNHKNITTFCFNGTIDDLFEEPCGPKSSKCNVYQKYRSYDGTCNNLEHPHDFGVAYKPFRRILPPDYSDGISAPRISKSGVNLPSARTVSLIVHRPIYRADPKFTIMLAVFGQFLDHDITATALNQGRNGNSISCCSDIQQQHPECFTVDLDQNDPYYKKYNLTCMEFVRSAAAPTCCFGPRQQLNQATSYLDASVIYGSDLDVANMLRSFQGGKLKMFTTTNNITLLPKSADPNDGCNREEENKKGRYCFMTGDARANENLHLTSMHLLWARQHNHIADVLAQINPKWNDEKLFQESRRILIAQLQHISYNEFLPIVLSDLINKNGLKPLNDGYYNGYNDNVDCSVANAFAASAFRFAHTLIPTLIKMIANDSANFESIQLHKMLFDPFRLYNSGVMDSAIRGAAQTSIQATDPYFTSELKEHMFSHDRTTNKTNGIKVCGLDLVSLNIQRGRDHGLAGYTSWREHCGFRRPRTFDQLTGDIDHDSLNYIQSIYSDVDDIDFYTGSLSEKPMNNSFLGPTISCILLDQFRRIKNGDRFWYENPGQFSRRQLQEIRKTTLASIICKNSDNLQYIQPEVMKKVDKSNPTTNCAHITKPELVPWKEELNRVSVADRKSDIKIVKH